MNKENEAGHNLVFTPEQNLKAVRNSAKELRKEMNCNDEFLSKAIDDAKSKLKEVIKGSLSECKEWPCVNDKVAWGDLTHKGVVKSISDGFAWIKRDNGEYTTVYISSLKKPKTPEEALRDDLINRISSYLAVIPGLLDNPDEAMYASHQAACELLTKYNITPKED